MSKVEAYLESDINLDDFDYLVEFGIGLIPELQGKDVTIFAPTIIADKITARNGKFATANDDEPKWQYEGKGLYFLVTPITLLRKTVNGEYKYSLMNSIDGTVASFRYLIVKICRLFLINSTSSFLLTQMVCRVILIYLANIFSRAKDVDPDSQKYLEDWWFRDARPAYQSKLN